MEITGDISITSTTHRKILKYNEFKKVNKREWKREYADLISVITGFTGLHRKKISPNIKIDRLQTELVKNCVTILNDDDERILIGTQAN